MREEQEGAGWVVDQYVFVTWFRLNPVYEVKWMAECRGTRGRGLVVQGDSEGLATHRNKRENSSFVNESLFGAF